MGMPRIEGRQSREKMEIEIKSERVLLFVRYSIKRKDIIRKQSVWTRLTFNPDIAWFHISFHFGIPYNLHLSMSVKTLAKR